MDFSSAVNKFADNLGAIFPGLGFGLNLMGLGTPPESQTTPPPKEDPADIK